VPPLSRWLIKSSFFYLVATFVTGVLAALDAGWDLVPGAAQLTPLYYHLFMLGWVSQLIFGVGNWMFPVYSRESPRGSERLGWAVYGLLNGGLLLLVLSEAARSAGAEQPGNWLQALATLFLWLAGTAFVANIWGRIRGK
jgi:hypothetical protein